MTAWAELATLFPGGVWCVDAEYRIDKNGFPKPRCLVAADCISGRTYRVWRDEMGALPPYPIGRDALFVCYNATAELSCHLALGWPMPARILDLFIEYSLLLNGRRPYVKGSRTLLAALAHYQLPALGGEEKKDMQELAMRRGPYTEAEKAALLDYCESDVIALRRLLPRMLPRIDLHHAVGIRGREMAAIAHVECNGIPIDAESLDLLRRYWDAIKLDLIDIYDREYAVYRGESFVHARFQDWLEKAHLLDIWPRTKTGRLATDKDTFRDLEKTYPQVARLAQLHQTLGRLRSMGLSPGADGRSRASVIPFKSKTGRSQPKGSEFVFFMPKWLRWLIKPAPGRALAYIDYSNQEYAIAAALSRDPAMLADYLAGDPYMAMAIRMGYAPPGATADTHAAVRDQFKIIVLAALYSMQAPTLARNLRCSEESAKRMLAHHHKTYATYWAWSTARVAQAAADGYARTCFRWTLWLPRGRGLNPAERRSLSNFPIQATGAEMTGLAAALAVERGVQVCALVHDAVLIEAAEAEIEDKIRIAQEAMAEASRIVLKTLTLRSDCKAEDIIRYPNRYQPKKGKEMRDTVWRLIHDRMLAELDPSAGAGENDSTLYLSNTKGGVVPEPEP